MLKEAFSFYEQIGKNLRVSRDLDEATVRLHGKGLILASHLYTLPMVIVKKFVRR